MQQKKAGLLHSIGRPHQLSLPKTLSAHTNALIGKLIADRDQLEAAESKIGKCS
jgi:hypothetical protein